MHPVKLTTSYGHEQFNILTDQFNLYSKLGLREEFKQRCALDFREQEIHLNYFLDDDIMAARYKMNEEDVEGFDIFNSQHDICSCLKYFSEKVY